MTAGAGDDGERGVGWPREQHGGRPRLVVAPCGDAGRLAEGCSSSVSCPLALRHSPRRRASHASFASHSRAHGRLLSRTCAPGKGSVLAAAGRDRAIERRLIEGRLRRLKGTGRGGFRLPPARACRPQTQGRPWREGGLTSWRTTRVVIPLLGIRNQSPYSRACRESPKRPLAALNGQSKPSDTRLVPVE